MEIKLFQKKVSNAFWDLIVVIWTGVVWDRIIRYLELKCMEHATIK